MVFSSIPFLFFFLPLCLLLYYMVSFSYKNTILLLFSLVFYAWGEPVYIMLMLFAAAVDYSGGLLMQRAGASDGRRKLVLCCCVVINLSVLAFFKYADFFVESINELFQTSLPLLGLSLPVGISFFTFQTMSYSIDLYRKHTTAEKKYVTYLTYVSMFPQLVAGPIVRYETVSNQLHERRITKEQIQNGFLRLMQGLFKKVLIANQVGALWEEIRLLEIGQASAATAWLGAVAFTLQLYFDFSAYSDMAIGMGSMLGFHFPENFKYPLSAVSVTDFWRRWHISLSTWFRDYVYIPLGGNRKGVTKHLRNMLIVWFLTGLWHGAAWNFVLWGLYYGILLALEKYVWGERLAALPKVLQRLYTIVIIVIGFVIFVFDDIGGLMPYVSAMFAGAGNALFGQEFLWFIKSYGMICSAAVLLAFPVYPWILKKAKHMGKGINAAMGVLTMAGYIILLLLTIACLVNDTYNPFLYFRF